MVRGRAFAGVKLTVVRQVVSGEKRPAQVCREHSERAAALAARVAFTPHELAAADALERKVAELERFCGQLALENAALKRAARATVAERHAMIAAMREAAPGLSLAGCAGPPAPGGPGTTRARRRTRWPRATWRCDAIERLVLASRLWLPPRDQGAPARGLGREPQAHPARDARESLLCQIKRRFVATTDAAHALRTYPNLLTGALLAAPDQAWVADITYVRLPTAFVYLACLLDAWSRRCVGWHLSAVIDTRLTLAALDRALASRRPAAGLIHHSDRGVQYASGDYVARLEGAGVRISMAAKGNPYENAKAESFFKTLKREEVYLRADLRGGRGQSGALHRGGLQREAAPFEPRLSAADRVRGGARDHRRS